MALVHAVVGNTREALESLTAAQDRGFFVRSQQRSDEFDVLRGLPEFKALVA